MAFVVAAQQLAHDLRSEELKAVSSALWMHSVDVATRSYVMAKHFKVCTADKAMLIGMLRNVGEFYLIARISEFPELAADSEQFDDFVSTWREPVGAALLEALDLPVEILESVEDGSLYGGLWPPTDIGDLLFVAALSAESENPFDPTTADERAAILESALHGSGRDELNALLEGASPRRSEMIAMICG